MTISLMRNKLIEEITKADSKKLREMYKLHQLVADDELSGVTWKTLSAAQKASIKQSLAQLDAGEGISAFKATEMLNEKYGIT